MLGKYRGKIDCTEEELQDILSQYKGSKLPCPVDEKGWVYGNFINGKTPYIVGEVIDSNWGGVILDYWYPVKKNTVGQFTGLKDKNDKEIYEGDILKAYPNSSTYIGRVYYEDAQWIGARDYLGYAVAYSGAEIIGNIHDNPDLIEVRE